MKTFKVSDIRLPIGYNAHELKAQVADSLCTSQENIRNVTLIKKSLDGRHGKAPVWNCSVACEVESEQTVTASAEEYLAPKTSLAELGLAEKKNDKPIYIIGSGPAGLFSALTLLHAGIKVVLFERGADVDVRSLAIDAYKRGDSFCEHTNVQYGEGGAGTFSDGKLNTGTKGFNSIIYGEFVAHGAPDEIMYSSRPHIGTDYLRSVVKNMRNEITALGGEVHFRSKLESFKVSDGKLVGIVVNGMTYAAENMILACGQSSDETYEMLARSGVFMEPKPFSLGVRIEHIQEKIGFSQYGKYAKDLPPADYKLACHLKNGRGVYTFCMCPGGEVVSAQCKSGTLFTNGMSNFDRGMTNANSAVLVSVTPKDYGSAEPLAGLKFRNKVEERTFAFSGDGKAPVQRVEDFIKGRCSKRFGEVLPSFKPGTVFCDLNKLLPDYISEGIKTGIKDFATKISEFGCPDGVITGCETRSSSPVKIVRDENGEASIKGIYPIGEGAGYAGGITSSASDGISAAIKIYNKI